MNTLRQLFTAMSLRERFLLVIFLWAILIVWLLSVIDTLRAEKSEFDTYSALLQTQRETFGRADQIATDLAEAKAGLDRSQTYDSSQLFAKIDSILRGLDLSFDLSSPVSREEEVFNMHTVNASLRNANLRKIITFVSEVQAENPYLSLEAFQLNPNNRDPNQFTAQFTVASFEFTREDL